MSRRKSARAAASHPPASVPEAAGVRSQRWAVVGAVAGALAIGAAWWAIDQRRPAAQDPVRLLDHLVPELATLPPRLAGALRGAIDATRRHPDDGRAWGELAALLDAHDMFERALPCYRQAMVLRPNEVFLAYNLALMLQYTGGDSGESERLLKFVATEEPQFPPVYFRLGELYDRADRPNDARWAYDRALEIDPDLAIAHYNYALVLLNANEAAAARRHLETALARAGPDQRAYASLAQACRRLGDGAAATEAAERSATAPHALALPDPLRFAIRQRGVSPPLLRERAKAALQANDDAEARRVLAWLCEDEPANPANHVALANILDRLGDSAAAAERRAQANRLRRPDSAAASNPTDSERIARQAVSLARDGRIEEALRAFEQAADRGPLSAAAQVDWGSALIKSGETAAALEHFRAAAGLDPDLIDAHMNLGITHEQLGERDTAILHYRRVIALRSDHPDALRRLTALGAAP